MEVELFIPCFIDQLYPETAKNLERLLEKLGMEVFYNKNQSCCGQMAFNSGYWDETRALGAKLISELATGRYIVGPSASCIGMIKNYYPEFFHNSGLHHEFSQVSQNIYEVSDFLVNVLKVKEIGAVFPHKVTYHDSCAALREYGIKDEPRVLLENVAGLELVEMEQPDTCCGFGGTFSVKHEPISTAMADQKVNRALDTGAEYIVSTDTSCLMHLQSFIDKKGLELKTIHIVDLLTHKL